MRLKSRSSPSRQLHPVQPTFRHVPRAVYSVQHPPPSFLWWTVIVGAAQQQQAAPLVCGLFSPSRSRQVSEKANHTVSAVSSPITRAPLRSQPSSKPAFHQPGFPCGSGWPCRSRIRTQYRATHTLYHLRLKTRSLLTASTAEQAPRHRDSPLPLSVSRTALDTPLAFDRSVPYAISIPIPFKVDSALRLRNLRFIWPPTGHIRLYSRSCLRRDIAATIGLRARIRLESHSPFQEPPRQSIILTRRRTLLSYCCCLAGGARLPPAGYLSLRP